MKTHLSIASGSLTALLAGMIAIGSAATWADDDGGGKVGISTPNAPAAIGPYSQAIRVGKTVYVSGEVGVDPANGQLETGIGAQTDRALNNVAAILTAAGLKLDDVVTTTVYMLDVSKDSFGAMNTAYGTHFNHPTPARATIQVPALPKPGALVEISAIAVLPGD